MAITSKASGKSDIELWDPASVAAAAAQAAAGKTDNTGNTDTGSVRTSGGQSAAAVTYAPAVTQADPDGSAYALAQQAAENARGGAPVYSGSFDDQIRQLYDQINGRADFSYDLNGDAFWQQYADKYTQAAKNAMRDTMGQAAALTGGYGSSYGQTVGQQAYDRRMEELMDIAPELYQMAYQRYSDEGDRMAQQLALARQMADDEYGKYKDQYNMWLTERDYADQQEKLAYSRQQDNRAMLQGLMALGYTPTDAELAAAGMSREAANAILAEYMRQFEPAKEKVVYRTVDPETPVDPGTGKKYTLDDLSADLAKVKHSNQKTDILKAYSEAVKQGKTDFSSKDLSRYMSDHHL